MLQTHTSQRLTTMSIPFQLEFSEITIRSLLKSFDPSVYVSLAFLFGIAAQFRAMNGYSLLRKILSSLGGRVGLLYAVVLVAAVFSPLILNDVVILILSPVLVKYSKNFGVSAAPLMVAEITYTNIGSSLTPFGNPQNILLWEKSGLSAQEFVGLTWMPVAVSALITAMVLYPLSRRIGAPRDFGDKSWSKGPAVYLALVGTIIFSFSFAEVPDVFSLGISFLAGFVFNSKAVKRIRGEFDVKSLLILYLLIASVTVVSLTFRRVITPYAQLAVSADQPYSALLVALISNIISNVPATQLFLTVTNIPPRFAPIIAVEAGLAGNIDPIGSLANLLALSIARQGGLGIKKMVVLQLFVGTVSFLPVLLGLP
jgi:Na+/H+ antiporter NhaD/arsenite permease-like protein